MISMRKARGWRATWLVWTLACFALPLVAAADPPLRALRLAHASGEASFAPAGGDAWVVARINRPLWIGDRIWSANGHVELELGGATLRLAPRTAVAILDFDDRIAQFEVAEGSVALHVRAIDERDATIEIATPTLAFVVRTEGDYRVDVDADRTAVAVRRGWAEVWGAGNAFRVDRRERFVFYATALDAYDVLPLPAADNFDRWARERARRAERALSARYVAPELVGYADLDDYGTWRLEPDLGSVWYPGVDAGWVPYRHGHWAWIDPWGWTWVDDAPWGFAPFHYGRWAHVAGRWGWVPGPREVRPAYAPALVAWVGGEDFSLTIASGPARGIAWFPLAPGEVWRPAYGVSRDYFTRVNVANTYVSQTTIVNVYDDVRAGGPPRFDYRFRRAPLAVTAVPVDTFVASRPVQRNVVRIDAAAFARAPVAPAPGVHPQRQSYLGPAPVATARPPAEALRRGVVAREAPPAAVPSLADRLNIVRDRGRPLDRETLRRPQPPAGGTLQPPASSPPRAQPAPGREGVRVVGREDLRPAPLPPAGTREDPRPPRSAPPAENVTRPRGGPPARTGADIPTPRVREPDRPQRAMPGAPPASLGGAPAVTPAQPPAARSPGERARSERDTERPREQGTPAVPPAENATRPRGGPPAVAPAQSPPTRAPGERARNERDARDAERPPEQGTPAVPPAENATRPRGGPAAVARAQSPPTRAPGERARSERDAERPPEQGTPAVPPAENATRPRGGPAAVAPAQSPPTRAPGERARSERDARDAERPPRERRPERDDDERPGGEGKGRDRDG